MAGISIGLRTATMSGLSFRRFTHSSSLREIAPGHLHALLAPHAEFLARHRAPLPADPDRIHYEATAVAILQPHPDTPAELVDALWHIHEMATPAAMEALLDEARRTGIELDPQQHYSPADIATQFWLISPEALRRKHAEQAVVRRKSFESFSSRRRALPEGRGPSTECLAALEAQVAGWFQERRRGVGARVFLFEHEHELRLVVRHGGPYRREGSLDDGEPGSVHYRPMAFGVIIFDRSTWELRINGGGKRERQLYRQAVGSHLFGDAEFFPARGSRYTLEPLRSEGRRSLVCADIPGIRHVRLTELRMFLGGLYRHARIEQAADVFLALEESGQSIPDDALLTAAKFEVVFSDSPKPRPVTVHHGNVAQYARDEDADLVEAFLRNRGFVQGGAHAALACA
jgi:hypothetical protein